MKFICAKCKRPLDSERLDDAIAIQLCEDCVENAEEAAKRDAYDEGHADGRKFPRGRHAYEG